MTRNGFGTQIWVPARALEVQVRVFEALGASWLRSWRARSLQIEVRGALEASELGSVERLESPKSHGPHSNLPESAGPSKVLLCKGSSKGLGLLDLLLVALIIERYVFQSVFGDCASKTLLGSVRKLQNPPRKLQNPPRRLQNHLLGASWSLLGAS